MREPATQRAPAPEASIQPSRITQKTKRRLLNKIFFQSKRIKKVSYILNPATPRPRKSSA